MTSVIRFFKKKIKPFKKCVSNVTTLTIERPNELSPSLKTCIDDKTVNYTPASLRPNESDNNLPFHTPNTFQVTSVSKFGISSVDNELSSIYNSLDEAQSNTHSNERLVDANFSDNTDDGLITQKNSCALQESTPFSEYNSIGFKTSEDIDAITFDIDEKSVTMRKHQLAKALNKKSTKNMNGTYTIGNKLRNHTNSIRSNSKKSSYEKRARINAQNKSSEYEASTLNSTGTSKNLNSYEASLNSDEVFGCSIKSEKNDDAKSPAENFQKRLSLKYYENAMATVTLSKTAKKRCIEKVKRASKNNEPATHSNNNMVEAVTLNHSTEKMRRSFSMPGLKDTVSPVLSNISKINSTKENDILECSEEHLDATINSKVLNNLSESSTSAGFVTTSTSTPHHITTENKHEINSNDINDTLDENFLNSLIRNSEKQSEKVSAQTPTNSQIENFFSSEKAERERLKRKAKVNRSASLLDYNNTSFTTFEEFADDEGEKKFIRNAQNKIRMSKTIKQMFQNVVKYQMNALGCLEKFYEAQVLKLETDRRRHLALNIENKEVISKFYDAQLKQLEQRVYSNLKYICRNKCTDCSNTSANDNSAKISKTVVASQKNRQFEKEMSKQLYYEDEEFELNEDMIDVSQSNFRRQLSLPFKPQHKQYHNHEFMQQHDENELYEFAQQACARPKYRKQFEKKEEISNEPLGQNFTRLKRKRDTFRGKRSLQDCCENANCMKNSQTNYEQINAVDDDEYVYQPKRQVKSASSLQVLCEIENKAASNMNKKRQILTNGSLNMAMHNSGISRNNSNGFLANVVNENFTATKEVNHFESKLHAELFQRIRVEEILSAPCTSSPTHARRHTYGSDKYFNLRSYMRNGESNSMHASVLRETQV